MTSRMMNVCAVFNIENCDCVCMQACSSNKRSILFFYQLIAVDVCTILQKKLCYFYCLFICIFFCKYCITEPVQRWCFGSIHFVVWNTFISKTWVSVSYTHLTL